MALATQCSPGQDHHWEWHSWSMPNATSWCGLCSAWCDDVECMTDPDSNAIRCEAHGEQQIVKQNFVKGDNSWLELKCGCFVMDRRNVEP